MSTTGKYFIGLGILVLSFYLGLTYLPPIVGTCMDGDCGFTIGEIVISFTIPLFFIALPVVLEMLFYRKGLAEALNDIGITRFNWTGISIAGIYLLPLLAFFPVFSLLTGSTLTLRPNWEWLIINIVLVNGFAEEILMRGFVFRHLREGRSFWRAAALSTLFFVIYHLPIILSSGVVIGVMAVIVAIPIGFLTAYSYERGSNTIWGPGLLHVVNNALVMLLVVPNDIQSTASSLYLLVGIVCSAFLLIQAYRSGYERKAPQRRSEPMVVNA